MSLPSAESEIKECVAMYDFAPTAVSRTRALLWHGSVFCLLLLLHIVATSTTTKEEEEEGTAF
jgi:hypothetical protein